MNVNMSSSVERQGQKHWRRWVFLALLLLLTSGCASSYAPSYTLADTTFSNPPWQTRTFVRNAAGDRCYPLLKDPTQVACFNEATFMTGPPATVPDTGMGLIWIEGLGPRLVIQ